MAGAPVMVVGPQTKRQTGREAQLGNIAAAKAIADVVRSSLGPKSMLKMLLDPMGGIVITNDGRAILRELDVSHPACHSMIELSRAQDEEVGDGTTSVVVLGESSIASPADLESFNTGELLTVAEPFLLRKMHPTVICNAYSRALEASLEVCESLAVVVDPENREQMRDLVRSSIGTKFVSRYGDLMADLAIDAVLTVRQEEGGRTEIDLKRFARVERIPGGEMSECRVLDGVMVNKDVTNARMKRKIENPRVVLLDCPLEYKKMESGAQLELTKEEDFEAILKMEEDFIQKACADIIALKPDVIFTEKGIADLAQHYFVKHGITAIRRIRKMDNDRISRATGATIVHRTDELTEDDVGTKCGLFEVRKLGDEYFTFLEKCKDPKACTIMLRGGSKDVLNELERNLQDAMQVARNIIIEPKLLPGGGATEMAISVALAEKARAIKGVEQWPFKAVGVALEVVPRTLAQNCGADVVRLMTELRAAKAGKGSSMLGVDGNRGVLADMGDLGVWDAFSVKTQTLKTAVEQATMLLRIDDIVSGGKKKQQGGMIAPEE